MSFAFTPGSWIFLVITASVVVANLLADLLYSRLDPRIRAEGQG